MSLWDPSSDGAVVVKYMLGHSLPKFLHLPRGEVRCDINLSSGTVRIWTKGYATTRRLIGLSLDVENPIKDVPELEAR